MVETEAMISVGQAFEAWYILYDGNRGSLGRDLSEQSIIARKC
jgi:hypothetical protein